MTQHNLNTSEGARAFVRDFFIQRLRRHDFTRYITTQLAADFACALAQFLSVRMPEASTDVRDVAWQAFNDAPTCRDMGRSKVDAAVDAALALWSGRPAQPSAQEALRAFNDVLTPALRVPYTTAYRIAMSAALDALPEPVAEQQGVELPPLPASSAHDPHTGEPLFSESKMRMFANAALAARQPVNQCDGCRANMPVEDGIHRNATSDFHGIHMACQAEKYDGQTVGAQSGKRMTEEASGHVKTLALMQAGYLVDSKARLSALTAAMVALVAPPAQGIDGYQRAFYELAGMMNIPAQPISPKEVWETQMRPALQAALAPKAAG